jgi:hypothetical protein
MPTERMGMCAGCGGVIWVDLLESTPLGSRGRTYIDGVAGCEDCGGHMEARWAVHTTPEVHLVRRSGKTWTMPVYAGPPAPWPHVPTHGEWLAAWGIDPPAWSV